MAKKEFIYKGRTLEQLQAMGLKELSEVLPAKVRRKIARGFTEQEKILLRNLKNPKKPIKTHCRSMIVLPEMAGKAIKIHNGKEFQDLMIEPDMIGHYLGEFAMTRKSVKHSAPGIGATKSSANVSVK